MSWFRPLFSLVLAWVFFAFSFVSLGNITSAGASESFPILMFQPHTLNMGQVYEGEKAEGELLLRNTGDVPLIIARVQTSCGCTTGILDEHILPPGGVTVLHVKVDTFAKRGVVNKEIWVSDDAGHTATAYLKMTVHPNPHMHMNRRSIFDAQCAACHKAPARGKATGHEIFAAVCAMCHGPDARGRYAPSLLGWHDTVRLEALISNGAGNHYMPGFAYSRGGPLTPAQVKTLAQWIVRLR